MTYTIYKLEQPQLQVGMPNTHKWAVGKEQTHGVEFVDAFRTKLEAETFIADQMGNIELTRAEAKALKSGTGLEGFAQATRLKKRAQQRALTSGKTCSLTYKGETLYVAQPENAAA